MTTSSVVSMNLQRSIRCAFILSIDMFGDPPLYGRKTTKRTQKSKSGLPCFGNTIQVKAIHDEERLTGNADHSQPITSHVILLTWVADFPKDKVRNRGYNVVINTLFVADPSFSIESGKTLCRNVALSRALVRQWCDPCNVKGASEAVG